jgi:hypothetical protein
LSDMGPKWKVTSQVTAVGQDANGKFVPGRNITYQLADGTSGVVFVANTNYTVDAVKAAIADDAGRVAGVAKLTSDS